MSSPYPKLTNADIVKYLKDAIEAGPLDQFEVAERAGVGTGTASGYVNREGSEIDKSFKALAFFIEAARASPEAFNKLLPLFGMNPIEDPPDPELREIVNLIRDCWEDVSDRADVRDQIRILRRLTGRERGRDRAATG